MKIRKTNVAGGVVFFEGDNGEYKILAIQRAKKDNWPNFYEFPRGGVEKGETIIQGLKREVKEEAGLDIIPIKYIDKFTYSADKGTRLSTQYNFLCKPKDPNQKVKLSFEHQDFKFITTPGEAELLFMPEMKKTVKKAFEMLDSDKTISTQPEYELSKTEIMESKNMIQNYLNQLQEVGPIAAVKQGSLNVYKKAAQLECKKKYSEDPKKRKVCLDYYAKKFQWKRYKDK